MEKIHAALLGVLNEKLPFAAKQQTKGSFRAYPTRRSFEIDDYVLDILVYEKAQFNGSPAHSIIRVKKGDASFIFTVLPQPQMPLVRYGLWVEPAGQDFPYEIHLATDGIKLSELQEKNIPRVTLRFTDETNSEHSRTFREAELCLFFVEMISLLEKMENVKRNELKELL